MNNIRKQKWKLLLNINNFPSVSLNFTPEVTDCRLIFNIIYKYNEMIIEPRLYYIIL